MDDRNRCCLFYFSRGTFVRTAVCLDTKGQASQSPAPLSFIDSWHYTPREIVGEKMRYLGTRLPCNCYALSVYVYICADVCVHCVSNKNLPTLITVVVYLHTKDFTFQQYCCKLCWSCQPLHLYKP